MLMRESFHPHLTSPVKGEELRGEVLPSRERVNSLGSSLPWRERVRVRGN
jgi:hypothetical protein